MKKIWDYFDETVEFPPDVAENILPFGTVWWYISSTFLNGFINYVTPISWYVIDRYNSRENLIKTKVFNKNEHGKWYDWHGTKKEYIDAIINNEIGTTHTELYSFQDDIVILAKIAENKYTFFWYDSDVSDCCIGRFETDDSESDVILSVESWLNEEKNNNKNTEISDDMDNGIVDYSKMPLSFLSGWLEY